MDFYQKYLLLCNSIKKTPSAVAEEIGSTRASVTRWKHGSRPTDAVLQRIAMYFDVDPSYFDDNPDDKKSILPEGKMLTEDQIKLLRLLPDLTADDLDELLLIAKMKASRHKVQDDSE